ncbi:hypothetical protein MTO96_034487 [Rhipicephalus appendiculatus]|uniref:Defensin n=1 Tax=Rhipicephalus appendiculatus TaxID=34631 RepID=A0A131YGP7_RHIAP
MSAANSAFLLIVAITIAMFNISSASSWAATGSCRNPGVSCPGYNSTCQGICKCTLVYETFLGAYDYVCTDPDYRAPYVRRY